MSDDFQDQYDDGEKAERPAPLPLRRETPSAEPYPLKALGKVLEGAARGIIDKVACPDAIAAQSVLATAALATQAHANISHPATGEIKPISLFLVTIAATGERKSAADAIALAPVKLREAELHDKHERDQRAYLDARQVTEKAREHALRRARDDVNGATKILATLAQPIAPLVPILTVPEPTLEGLHKLFATGEPSLGLFSDEGGSFIGGHAMSEEIRLRTAAGLSSMWDGSPIKRIRAGDAAMYLRGRRLSLHLMVQPGISDQLFASPMLLQQGLPSRILVVAPKSIAGTRMQRPVKSTTESALKRYDLRILQLLRHKQRRAGPGNPELQPRSISLSAEARRRWITFADEFERELAEGGRCEPIRGFANKVPEHALRIAAVFELMDNVEAAFISDDAMGRGIAIARYYAGEALRMFDNGSSSEEIKRAEKLLKWLHHSYKKPVVGLSQIYQYGPNSIRDAAKAREAIHILQQHHWLHPIQGGALIDGKRHREAWEVIPG